MIVVACPMTPEQIEIASTLGRCSFLPGTKQKRFARNMAALAAHNPDQPLTPKQARYLYLMAHRYRRQLPPRIVGCAQALEVELSQVPDHSTMRIERKRGSTLIDSTRAIGQLSFTFSLSQRRA